MRHTSSGRRRTTAPQVVSGFSWSPLRLSDPQFDSVVVRLEAAHRLDLAETLAVPHVFRVVPRPDAVHDLALVVAVQAGRRRKAWEGLPRFAGVRVRIVKATQI